MPTSKIGKVAVLGSGTMGSGIASHLTNAGVSVVLLDVPSGGQGEQRNGIATSAIDRMVKANPPVFMHPDNVERITVGNIEDDLERVSEVDWVVEAIVERLDTKRELYHAIDGLRHPGTVVSSNTSTIPLAQLTQDMSDAFKQDFCITHFFNPVRYMRLLEIVQGPQTRPEVIEALTDFCDRALGKGVVPCHDTPGFLGNRVGVYALQVGIVEAERNGLTVVEADAIMGRPMGIPKTGVFGLYDLIGIDLMLDVVKSLEHALPTEDAFHAVAPGIALAQALVEKGCKGDKSGAGFYRTQSGSRQAVDLESGEYMAAPKVVPEAVSAVEVGGLRALVDHPSPGGRFAWRVLGRTLAYAASLVPEVAEEPFPIDEAMKLGYNWTQGPFEMIDELGADWFAERLQADGIEVPPYLRSISGPIYRTAGRDLEQLAMDAAQGTKYQPVHRSPGVLRLVDFKRGAKPALSNEAASLWDVGDGVACIEFHTKANALSPVSMALVHQAVERAGENFAGVLIYNDAAHFSVGFNLEFVLELARKHDWDGLDAALHEFQNACLACKYSPIPVVSAPCGMALGGGCEVVVQSHAAQAHANTTMGLVESMVGLIPGGGGCKEMLARWTATAAAQGDADGAQLGAMKVFELIGMGKTAASPQDATPGRFFRPERDHYTMNRDRLLSEGKALVLQLASGYAPDAPPAFVALGDEGRSAMGAFLDELDAKGITTPHDLVVGKHLAHLLCGGDAPRGTPLEESDLIALEREAFVALAQTPATVERIEHMLGRGSPLRN